MIRQLAPMLWRWLWLCLLVLGWVWALIPVLPSFSWPGVAMLTGDMVGPRLTPPPSPVLEDIGPPAVEPVAAPTPVVAALVVQAQDPVIPFAPRTPTLRAPQTLLDEHFAVIPAGWPNNPQGTAWAADGTYRLSARSPGQFVAVGVPVSNELQDVMVKATFRKLGGPAGGGYGLIVRDRGPGRRDGRNMSGVFYVLEVGDLGEVGIWRRNDDRWVELQPWSRTTAVQQGTARNDLVASAVGDRLTLLVNGVQVASVVQPATAGGVGVFVGGDFNDVVLEHLIVEVPVANQD